LKDKVRLIAVGVKYIEGGTEYRWMADEDGMSFWINGKIENTMAYGDITSGKQPGRVSFETFDGERPGIWITLNHVAQFQITFKDKGHKKSDPGIFIEDNHSMGFKTLSTDGISHSVGGILGQFIVPNAYTTLETSTPNFVIFHNRHIPADQKTYHAEAHCMKVEDKYVQTLLGNEVSAFYVDTLFGTADPARIRDHFLGAP